MPIELPQWFRSRGYAHFDERPTPEAAIAFATDPDKVARHAFWPLIRFDRKSVRFGRDEETGRRKFLKLKVRPISYAAHVDSHVFSKYAVDLAGALERRYQAEFGPSVLAYRHFDPPRSNIHFAKDAFDEVRRRGMCDVVGVDVEDFFGSLVHVQLKECWMDLIANGDQLPPDHYALFKAISRYSWVSRPELQACLGRVVPRRRTLAHRRICTPQEFRQLVRPKLKLNEGSRGIPQGSPISAVLANMYMLRTDEVLFLELSALGATYRRYSDDILVVCEPGTSSAVETLLSARLGQVGLSIQPTKTVRVRFRAAASGQSGVRLGADGTEGSTPAPLQYLGLLWDGHSVRLRSTTLARFLGRLVRAVHAAESAARASGETRLLRRKLYRRFSHLGRSARVFGPQPILGRRNRNFLHYAKLAAEITGSRALRRQVGKQWVRLEREIRKAELRLNGG